METPETDHETAAGEAPAAVFARVPVVGMAKRADFLATAKGRVAHAKGFVLQARRRADDSEARLQGRDEPVRIGFTCSRKVGNAVARNRAKRRLREAARLELPRHGRPGWDYVLIGRRAATAAWPFAQLRADLVTALAEVHR